MRESILGDKADTFVIALVQGFVAIFKSNKETW